MDIFIWAVNLDHPLLNHPLKLIQLFYVKCCHTVEYISTAESPLLCPITSMRYNSIDGCRECLTFHSQHRNVYTKWSDFLWHILQANVHTFGCCLHRYCDAAARLQHRNSCHCSPPGLCKTTVLNADYDWSIYNQIVNIPNLKAFLLGTISRCRCVLSAII